MLYREIMAVCSEIHTKHINTLCGQKVELLNAKLVVHIVTTFTFIELNKFLFSSCLISVIYKSRHNARYQPISLTVSLLIPQHLLLSSGRSSNYGTLPRFRLADAKTLSL